MYRKILVPLDGSPLAETAVAHARLLATTARAPLELLRVTLPHFVQLPDGCHMVVENGDREEADDYLRRWQEKLSGEGLTVTYTVRAGNVAEEIVHHAAAGGTDLIVMSTHGRTGTRLYAYGSVAYEVLRIAPCSVLVVRAAGATQDTQEDGEARTR